MNIIRYPQSSEYPSLSARPKAQQESLIDIIEPIFSSVQTRGDSALLEYTQTFDKTHISSLRVTDAEREEAFVLLDPALRTALDTAYSNITTFHQAQKNSMDREAEQRIETMQGVVCWRRSVPIGRVGLYIPGGTAPLFSTVFMLGIPAQIAGCPVRILCTPPNSEGNIHPAIIVAAQMVGITDIFKVGGAQAIAGMTFGTETIPAVYKIFGPGNKYVVAAKNFAQQFGVAIDMPAGPSEVLVIADTTANPSHVAADLLAQAEHDTDAQVVLITTDASLMEQTLHEIDKQCALLPRKEFALAALSHSRCILVKNIEDALAISNQYAPEHLILSIADAENIAQHITDAGSVFIGHHTPESVGDYASGTNHTLPTNGYARAYSGVSVDSFMKKITYQSLTESGLRTLAPTVMAMAYAEGLEAHAQAVALRVQSNTH
jgi:histidinol dehydrogenase